MTGGSGEGEAAIGGNAVPGLLLLLDTLLLAAMRSSIIFNKGLFDDIGRVGRLLLIAAKV